MKYLDATLDLPPELQHPMEEYLRNSDDMERVEVVAWNLTTGPVEYLLAYIEGAIDPYRERIESVDS